MRTEQANPPIETPSPAPERLPHFHQVLILSALSLFSGGDDSKSLGDLAREAIADEDRRATAETIVAEVEQLRRDHDRILAELRSSFFAVASRYDATAEELDASLSSGVSEAERIQMQLLDARTRFVDCVTASEWSEIFPRD